MSKKKSSAKTVTTTEEVVTTNNETVETETSEESSSTPSLADVINSATETKEEVKEETPETEVSNDTPDDQISEEPAQSKVEMIDTDDVNMEEVSEKEKNILEESLASVDEATGEVSDDTPVEEASEVEESEVEEEVEEKKEEVDNSNDESPIEGEVIKADVVTNESDEPTASLDVVVTGSETTDEENYPPSHVVVTDGLKENPETADVNDDTDVVDPLPEIEGKLYVKAGENLPFSRLQKIESILDNLPYKHITTASGKVLVGPFVEEKEAFAARKKLLSKGVKGIVVIME